MKEKQGNKPNSYGKLMKRMLIYMGIGGVCGFFVGIFMMFGVKNGMSDLSDLVRPLALPIIAVIFVVSIVLMEFYSRKLKDTMKHLEEAAAVLVFLLLKPCLSLFFSGDVDMAAMMPWAKTYSYMCALFYVPLCTIFIFRNAMQGCGYGFLPMMGGVSELFARLIVAVIAMKVISYPLACFCDPAAWVTAAVFTGVSYLFVMKDIDKKYDSKTSTAPIS